MRESDQLHLATAALAEKAAQSCTTNNGFRFGFSNFVFALKRLSGVVIATAAAMEAKTRETLPNMLVRTTNI